MDFLSIIKEKRKLLGLTQKEVADKLFIRHNTYSQYETGNRKMEAELLIKLANILHINLSSLQTEDIQKEGNCHSTTIDFLTGLSNRSYFIDNVAKKMSKYHPFSLLLIDIDKFKLFNDKYGHDLGDDILKKTGEILSKHSIQPIDSGRLGGEIFGYIVDSKQDISIIKTILDSLNYIHPEIHFSYGISEYKKIMSLEELFKEAYYSLYLSKAGEK